MGDVYDLPYNQVSFKASHNSYDRDEPFIEQLDWNSTQPWQAGCRGLELDINQSETGNRWSVGHVGGYDDDERQLSLFLDELNAWSDRNPGHDVVTLYLDLKSVQPGFPHWLDAYIQTFLFAPLYRPADLMGSYDTLELGARYNGWPTLNQLRGKFILVVSGDGDAKEEYAHDNPRARYCFADKDFGQDEAPHSQTRVFFNYHLYENDYDEWGPVFRAQASRPETIMRGYVIDEGDFWGDALAAGANLLTTNRVKNNDWAMVSNSAPFTKLKPLG
jgi:hypothetical protein